MALRPRTTQYLGKSLQERSTYDLYEGSDSIWLTRKGNPYQSRTGGKRSSGWDEAFIWYRWFPLSCPNPSCDRLRRQSSDKVLVGISVRLFDQPEDRETFLNHGADVTYNDQMYEKFTMQLAVELTVSEQEMEQLEADHQFWIKDTDDWLARL